MKNNEYYVGMVHGIRLAMKYFEESQSLPEKMPSTVTVYRYVRPCDRFGNHQPNRGLTICAEIDYQKQQVIYGVAICEGDNFEKSVGRRLSNVSMITRSSNFSFTVPLSNGVVSSDGVVDMLMQYFLELEKKTPIIRSILKQFDASL
jgi:hypothetical protein